MNLVPVYLFIDNSVDRENTALADGVTFGVNR